MAGDHCWVCCPARSFSFFPVIFCFRLLETCNSLLLYILKGHITLRSYRASPISQEWVALHRLQEHQMHQNIKKHFGPNSVPVKLHCKQFFLSPEQPFLNFFEFLVWDSLPNFFILFIASPVTVLERAAGAALCYSTSATWSVLQRMYFFGTWWWTIEQEEKLLSVIFMGVNLLILRSLPPC